MAEMQKRRTDESSCGVARASAGEGCGSGNKIGARMMVARRVTLAAVLVAVLVSLAFDSGLGTPSSFGIGSFSLLCPLGGIEAMIADRSFIPVAAISAGVVLVFSLVFGRAWCAWGCPAPAIRRFFKREPKREHDRSHDAADAADAEDAAGGSVGAVAGGCAALQSAWSLKASLRHIGRDPRTWTFVAVLVAALIAGLPLFCLVCPIGLTFGTVGSLWHLIVDKQMTMSVLVFPAALLVELVLFRKWCLNLCPVAGLLGIVGQFAVRFRPKVNRETCLRYKAGTACEVCAASCPEHIDLHAADTVQQLGECSRCGECAKHCPTASIDISL